MSNTGLEGVIVAQSKLSAINGEVGELIYVGYDIDDLARNTTFEEVAYLLWNLRLPNRAELEELEAALAAERAVRPEIIDLLRSFPKDAEAMAALRTAVSALSFYDPEADDNSEAANRRKAIRLTAKMPTIVAAFDRIRKGKEPVAPRPDLAGTSANFLYMLNGEAADELRVRTFDAALVLHAEHGMNASTFSARVTAATLSDMYSAIVSAIGTLKGPLHGGANTRVMEMLRDVDQSGKDAGEWVREALARGDRVMGFGHRVYKATDPRATVLRELADQIMQGGEARWLDLSDTVRATMAEEMEKKGKKIYPNVDFFSASVYTTLGLDMDLFTPIFAVARVTGWTAHLFEQYANNRLIRPEVDYTGPRGLKVSPIEQR